MTTLASSIKVLVPGSTILAVLQAAPQGDVTTIGAVERLGLVGVLILAVVVLWRRLETLQKQRDEERDSDHKAALAAQLKMTEAIALNTETMQDVKEFVIVLKASMDKFINVREALEGHSKRDR